MNSIFEEVGLTKTEALAYEEMLNSGEVTPPRLAKAICISRENAYYVLKSLIKHNLAEQVNNRKTATYRPLSPERLKDMFHTEKLRFAEKEKAIEAILPKLNTMYSLRNNKPSVAYFEGIKGIKLLYEDIFKGEIPKELLIFRSPEDEKNLDLDWIKKDNRRLTLAGVHTRLISPKSEGKLFSEVNGLKINRDIRYSDEDLSLPAEISIYNNRVNIVSYKKDKIGAIIESKDFADSMRKIFNHIWEGLE